MAKNILTAEEINTIFLFATDHWRNTLWHVAAEKQNVEILEELWER